MVAGPLLPESIMTEKLARRGLRVPRGYEPDVFSHTTVAEVMTRDVDTIPAGSSAAFVRAVLTVGSHQAYPVVDPAGQCLGVVMRCDAANVGAVAAAVTVSPRDTLVGALDAMADEQVEQLAVVDDGRLVGICTRTDVLHARRRRARHDRQQQGWVRRRRPEAGAAPPR
jgi:CBS-domain-containing membrane protein